MLKDSSKPILQAAAIVANEHHEKWDGSGHPNATAGRVYKKAWDLEKILELFREEKKD
ncbi:MAG: hypothetical protein U9O86_04660 [Campylobacterota bacterium]|nr:hypothetical protein [Campylobacterota bacterium]